MHVGMFLRSTFDFHQFLLNFRKIVGVELLHYVDLENFDGTQLGYVGPVRVLFSNMFVHVLQVLFHY